MKPMTLNTMLWDYKHEGEVYELIDNYRDTVPGVSNSETKITP